MVTFLLLSALIFVEAFDDKMTVGSISAGPIVMSKILGRVGSQASCQESTFSDCPYAVEELTDKGYKKETCASLGVGTLCPKASVKWYADCSEDGSVQGMVEVLYYGTDATVCDYITEGHSEERDGVSAGPTVMSKILGRAGSQASCQQSTFSDCPYAVEEFTRKGYKKETCASLGVGTFCPKDSGILPADCSEDGSVQGMIEVLYYGTDATVCEYINEGHSEERDGGGFSAQSASEASSAPDCYKVNWSTNGRCGPTWGDTVCTFGCCSGYGWCHLKKDGYCGENPAYDFPANCDFECPLDPNDLLGGCIEGVQCRYNEHCCQPDHSDCHFQDSYRCVAGAWLKTTVDIHCVAGFSGQLASEASSAPAPKLRTLDQEYHLKEFNTDTVMDKEESWIKNERIETNAMKQNPGSTSPMMVKVFAAIGLCATLFGAFKHYTQK